MPKKSTEYIVQHQAKGGSSELAGPYWQKRDALRALPKLLEAYGWQPAVRAIVYERPAPGYNGDTTQRDDRKRWRRIATAEKQRGSREVRVTESRAVGL